MFVPIKFKAQVELTPWEMDIDFETTILSKLRRIYEGKCSKYGYIKPGSISISKRSAGMLTKQHFNGHIRYDTLCRADVCNPVQGMVLSAIVRNKNQLGLLAEGSVSIGGKDVAILDIIIPGRAAGISSEVDVDDIQISDRINIEVLGKRYQLQDTKISIIGRVVIGEDKGGDEDGDEDGGEAGESRAGEGDGEEDEFDDDQLAGGDDDSTNVDGTGEGEGDGEGEGEAEAVTDVGGGVAESDDDDDDDADSIDDDDADDDSDGDDGSIDSDYGGDDD